MGNDEGFDYGFVQHSRAWYADACLLGENTAEEIMVGLYATEGGCKWEFAIRWIRLPKPTPRVEVFSDGWQAFAEVPELFAELTKRDSLTPAECCELLLTVGFADMTKVESPHRQADACEADPLNALRAILPYAENELASLLDCQRRDGGLEREVDDCEAKVATARQALGMTGKEAA